MLFLIYKYLVMWTMINLKKFFLHECFDAATVTSLCAKLLLKSKQTLQILFQWFQCFNFNGMFLILLFDNNCCERISCWSQSKAFFVKSRNILETELLLSKSLNIFLTSLQIASICWSFFLSKSVLIIRKNFKLF